VARLRSITVTTGRGVKVCTVKSGFIPGSKVQVYFLENRDLFQHPVGVGNSEGDDWHNELETLEYFGHATLQLTLLLQWMPDIIHCNDWHTALVPYLMRNDERYRRDFATTRAILQLKPADYAQLAKTGSRSLTVDSYLRSRRQMLVTGAANADLVVNVTPSDVVDMGAAVRPVVENRANAKKTAPNRGVKKKAITSEVWHPGADRSIPCRYGADDFQEGKAANKKALLKKLKLMSDPALPVVAVAPGKSLGDRSDLIVNAGAELPSLPATFVFLPTGDPKLDTLIKRIVSLKPDAIAIASSQQEDIKHLVVAGADMVLMPVPCPSLGFTFTEMLLYGTVPIVGYTPGTAELMDDYGENKKKGAGFTFNTADSAQLKEALQRALKLYRDPQAWSELQQRGVCADFRWTESACRLVELYENALKKKPVHPGAAAR